MPARITLVQVLALYTDPESHSEQRHRQTDGRQDYANSRSNCKYGSRYRVAVRSAKNVCLLSLACNADLAKTYVHITYLLTYLLSYLL